MAIKKKNTKTVFDKAGNGRFITKTIYQVPEGTGGGGSGPSSEEIVEIVTTAGFIKESELANYALKSDLPDLKDYALKTAIPVAGVNYFALTDISDGDHANRHSMMMKNDDSISGYALKDNQSYNLVMVNKWDVADFGSRGLPINLNGSKARPTYNDDKELALKEDIPDLMSVGMYYPGVKVDSQKLFALTKESTETDIKAALQLEAATGGYKLPTAAMLDDCLGKGYQLLSNWMPVSIAWNGAAYVFYTVGQNYMMKPTGLYTVALKITPEGQYSVFQAAKVEEFAFVDDLERMPIICTMPFRKVSGYLGDDGTKFSKETVLGWFGVSTIDELKKLVLKKPIYLMYGITLTGKPMYYYIPCQYVAFTANNKLELVTDGLDTNNDKLSRYKIVITFVLKSEATVEDTAIAITVDNYLHLPDLPEDADSKTYQLKAVNGKLSWVE